MKYCYTVKLSAFRHWVWTKTIINENICVRVRFNVTIEIQEVSLKLQRKKTHWGLCLYFFITKKLTVWVLVCERKWDSYLIRNGWGKQLVVSVFTTSWRFSKFVSRVPLPHLSIFVTTIWTMKYNPQKSAQTGCPRGSPKKPSVNPKLQEEY